MRLTSFSPGLLTAGILLACTSPSNASVYTYTDLGTLGGNYSYATAINNSGQIVGLATTTGNNATSYATLWNGTTATNLGWQGPATAINASGQIAGSGGGVNSLHAVRVEGSTVTDLGTLGGSHSFALGINANGQVVGRSLTTNNGDVHATLWNGTVATDLGTPGLSSEAFAINDSGRIVGYAQTADAVVHASVWNGATVSYLGTLGGASSIAIAINATGQVVGVSETTSGAIHAALWNGITVTDLGTLGGDQSNASSINASGQVVGSSLTTPGDFRTHATLWDGGSIIDLNSYLDASTVDEGWVLEEAFGINDLGSIVGLSRNTLTGFFHAYELSVPNVAAVPEPESYSLVLVGLGLLCFVTARRKRQTLLFLRSPLTLSPTARRIWS